VNILMSVTWCIEFGVIIWNIFTIRHYWSCYFFTWLPRSGKSWKIQVKSKNWGFKPEKVMKIPENLKKSGILISISPLFTISQKCQYFYQKNLNKSGILIPGSQEKLSKNP
jgi:hypothetical protein